MRVTALSRQGKLVMGNTLAAFLLRGASLGIGVVSLPLSMRYLGGELAYGLWATILSMMGWLLYLDFGIGNALRNALILPLLSGDKRMARKLITSAYGLTALVGTLLYVMLFIAIAHIPWHALLNIAPEVLSAQALVHALRCVLSAVMMQFILRIIMAPIYAAQLSAMNNALPVCTSAIMLFVLLFGAPAEGTEAGILRLSHAYVFAATVPYLAATLLIFRTRLKGLAPHTSFVSRGVTARLLRAGGTFFLCQLLYMLFTGTNAFLIAFYTGPASVASHQVYDRLFSTVGSLYILALSPMWSAVSKALAQGNRSWLQSTFHTMERLALLSGVLQCLLVLCLPFLFRLWLGADAPRVDATTGIGFALWGTIFAYQSLLSAFLSGAGQIRFQIRYYLIALCVKLLALHLLMRYSPQWDFAIWASMLTLLPYCISGRRQVLHSIINNTKQKAGEAK